MPKKLMNQGIRMISYYDRLNPEPNKAGYSDIRMWPCYIALCLSTLFFAQWLGLFWSFVLVGVPVFVVSLLVSGVTKPHTAPIKSWKVYEVIDQANRDFEQQNHLLRRNMRIIEDDEISDKNLKKKSRGLPATNKLG